MSLLHYLGLGLAWYLGVCFVAALLVCCGFEFDEQARGYD